MRVEMVVAIGVAMSILLWLLCGMLLSGEAGDADDSGLDRLPSLLWMAPTLAGGGYSSEAISYALALDKEYREHNSSKFALRQFAEHYNFEFVKGLPQSTSEVMKRLMSAGSMRPSDVKWDIAICHATPDVWHKDGAFGWGISNPCPPADARYAVGRTMYETDRVPSGWVPRINQMAEVWVPSEFAVSQFVESGIDKSRIIVVPEAVDTTLFDPAVHEPMDLKKSRKGKGKKDPGADATNKETVFRFLSVFKWEKRKGWDVLLKAYFQEFSADDNVELILKTSRFHDNTNFEERIRQVVASGSVKEPLAKYSVIASDLPLSKLPTLYRSVDAFVLPSRGEGWGRPHVEAMAMALPVIATNWSGSTAFLSEHCSLPLKIDGLSEVDEGPKGHKWAEPSLTHLQYLMRWVTENPSEAKEIGRRAREEMVTRFSPEVIVRQHVLPHLRRIADGLPKSKKKRKRRKTSAEL